MRAPLLLQPALYKNVTENIHARTHTHTHTRTHAYTCINFQNLFGTLLVSSKRRARLLFILQFRDIAYRVVALLRRYIYDFLALCYIYIYISYRFTPYMLLR